MKKRFLFLILFFVLFFIFISLYSTFSFDENDITLEESFSDYNLKFSIDSESNKKVSLLSNESKIVDVVLKNTYSSRIEYAMFYKLVNADNDLEGFSIYLDDDSKGLVNNKLLPNEECVVSIKIVNNSNKDIDVIVGSVVGFENGDISELLTNDITLIK